MDYRISYCTLFDSNYLERGLALIESICAVSDNTLYVVAIDSVCEDYLRRKAYKSVVVISMDDFADDELLEVRKNRDWRGFCWTCQSAVPYYVLTRYKCDYLFYMDADIFFYNSPDYIIDEMHKMNCSVGISPHNFPNSISGRHLKKMCGKYCSGFIAFKNDLIAQKVAKEWRTACIAECTSEPTGKSFGDQKYLEMWEIIYGESIYVITDASVGIAPWNISKFELIKGQVYLKKSHQKVTPIFYHFHGTGLESNNTVNLHLYITQGNYDNGLIEHLYRPYFNLIKKNREKIKQDNVTVEKHTYVVKKLKGVEKIRNYIDNGIIYLAVTYFFYITRKGKDTMYI